MTSPPRSYAPALLALLPLLRNLVIVHPRDAVWGLAAAATLFVPTILLENSLIRRGIAPVKAALVAILALVAFTHFGALHDVLEAAFRNTAAQRMLHLWVTLVLLVTVTAVAIVWLLRTKRSLWRLLQIANLTALILVAGGAVTTVIRLRAVGQIRAVEAEGFRPAEGPRRDVYYLVMDAYTSAESLSKHWGYDNSPFLNHLRQRGFIVVTNAQSDYAYTQMCILSAFDMSLVPLGMDDAFYSLRLGSDRLIRDSQVVRQFRDMGYEIVNLSMFDLDDVPRAYEFGPARHGPYHVVLKNTLWGRLRLARWNRRMDSIDVGNMNLDLLARMASQPTPSPGRRPRFVYLHLMMPHTPYVFEADGRRRNGWLDSNDLTNHLAYLGQLIHASRLMQTNLDTLLAKYPEPPIIVLQGDHGFRWLNRPDAPEEPTTILNAFLLPENRGARLPADIRPLNTFRFLFNEYFGAHYGFETNRPRAVPGKAPMDDHGH